MPTDSMTKAQVSRLRAEDKGPVEAIAEYRARPAARILTHTRLARPRHDPESEWVDQSNLEVTMKAIRFRL